MLKLFSVALLGVCLGFCGVAEASDSVSVHELSLNLIIAILAFIVFMCLVMTWYAFRRPIRKWFGGAGGTGGDYSAAPIGP